MGPPGLLRCGPGPVGACPALPGHRVALQSYARQVHLQAAHGRGGSRGRLPGLLPPALSWGDRDRRAPASFTWHACRALPGAAAVILEDSGHVPRREQPVDTVALVRGLLDPI